MAEITAERKTLIEKYIKLKKDQLEKEQRLS